MAWSRKVELSVGKDGTGTLVSDLDVDFKVERSLTFAENTAEFVVYNARLETRREILRQGNNLIFKAGHEDEGIGTLFVGSIIAADSRKSGPSWQTEVLAAAMRGQGAKLDYTTVSLSYGAGALVIQPLRDLATALGLALYGEAQAQVKMPNGFSYAGAARGALKEIEKVLKANEVGLYIDNAEIIVYRSGEQQGGRFGSIYLNYETGLLAAEDVTEAEDAKENRRRIRFRSVLIPRLQPNGLITLASQGLKGSFLVERVTFSGNNYGGEFQAEGEAVA